MSSFSWYGDHRVLRSFPTRRSSDLTALLINTLLVEPRWGRRGHGSRLLAAAVDLAREEGFTRALTWTLEASRDRKSTRLNSSHSSISYAVFCLKKKKHPM